MSSTDHLTPPREPDARPPASAGKEPTGTPLFAGRYRTLLVVVDEDAADGLLDTLCHHDGRLFAVSERGVTPAALAAGADPQEWVWEDEEGEDDAGDTGDVEVVGAE